MIAQDSPVVMEKGLLPRGKVGRSSNESESGDRNKRLINENINNEEGKLIQLKQKQNNYNDQDYTQDLKSRFGTAFLPFASQLESVDKVKTIRKRRGKNQRKQPTKIALLPNYQTNNKHKSDLFESQKQINAGKITNKIKAIDETANKAINKLEWQGETMNFDQEWPNVDKRKTMRIFHINLNGVTSHNNYLEWEMTMAFLMDMQVDVYGLTEINLDLNNGMIRDTFIQSGKHFDNYMRMATSSSLQKVGNTPFKMGGTVTGTNGCWSGRIISQGSDELGRWSYVKLQTRHGKAVVFITTYLPRKPTKDGGSSTIFRQMEADLFKKNGKIIDPRKALLEDLHKYIELEHSQGNNVFLMGDMNDNLGLNEGQINVFLHSLRMSITYHKRHGENSQLPPTHDRGKTCLDMIACSDHLTDSAIVRAGYAPFYFNFFTDHRGVYVDLDIESVFHSPRPDTTRAIYKRFTTIHVPRCSKYLRKLEELLDLSKIGKQIDELEIKYKEHDKNECAERKKEIITTTKVFFKKVTEFMICAEKWVGPNCIRTVSQIHHN